MRKVVTGDQVAQIRNPDPLAFPIWRAPVYRTPGWIIAIAQLCRFTWLAGPARSSGTRSCRWSWRWLGFTWSETGWLGVTLLVDLGGAGPGVLAGGVAGVVRPPCQLLRRAVSGGRGGTGAGGRR